MRNSKCSKVSCVISRQLTAIRMSEIDRRRAAYTLRDAEAIVDGVIWVKDRIASLGAVLLKPSFRQS